MLILLDDIVVLSKYTAVLDEIVVVYTYRRNPHRSGSSGEERGEQRAMSQFMVRDRREPRFALWRVSVHGHWESPFRALDAAVVFAATNGSAPSGRHRHVAGQGPVDF